MPAAYIKADKLIEEFKTQSALMASLYYKTKRYT